MCGIAGILEFNAERGVPEHFLKAMAETLVHRGPDMRDAGESDSFATMADTSHRAPQRSVGRSRRHASPLDAGGRRARFGDRGLLQPNVSAPGLLIVTMLLTLANVACESGTGKARDSAPAPPSDPRALRVAAVGDSITYGSGLEDRERHSYPAQLGRVLGEGYDVRNFGVSGRTMLRSGDHPYWAAAAFEAAKAFEPDIVIIMLGTNDTKPQNWQYRDEFVADYAAMIDAFAALPSRPRIWISKPMPTFGRYGVRDPVIRDDVIPMIERVARDRQVPVIDLYAALQGRADLFSNGIHPNAEGARLIAETVAEAIQRDRAGAGTGD